MEMVMALLVILSLNASGWLMIIPGAGFAAIPFIVYIVGKDNGWRKGYREAYAKFEPPF